VGRTGFPFSLPPFPEEAAAPYRTGAETGAEIESIDALPPPPPLGLPLYSLVAGFDVKE
jgi:hypothetical protein